MYDIMRSEKCDRTLPCGNAKYKDNDRAEHVARGHVQARAIMQRLLCHMTHVTSATTLKLHARCQSKQRTHPQNKRCT